MTLNIHAATSWLDAVLEKQMLPEQCADEDFVDDYLDKLDASQLDRDGAAAYKFITEALKSLSPEDSAMLEAMRKRYRMAAYMKTIRAFGDPELAAYVSDDIDLIAMFLLTGNMDHHVETLMACYDNCVLPDL